MLIISTHVNIKPFEKESYMLWYIKDDIKSYWIHMDLPVLADQQEVIYISSAHTQDIG